MKQKNKIQLLLVAAFAGLSVMCYAQQAKMCKNTPGGYNIVSLQDPSDPSSYEWWEDGKPISGATAAVYTVPADKAEGNYTYIRRSKKEGCDWASSNAYTVEVLICKTIGSEDAIGTKGTFQDPRDQKVYKTVKMPDGKVWMAENLNYQSGLTFNQQAGQANGQPYTSTDGTLAIGSFWCPAINGATLADKNTCNVYGALYTWETAMSTDGGKDDIGGKLWNESSVSGHYHDNSTTPATSQNDPKVRGICPAGYHLPSEYEWAAMLVVVDPAGTYLGLTSIGWSGSAGAAGTDNVGAGVQVKSASTFNGTDPGTGAWLVHDMQGNDATGLAILPSGFREDTGKYTNRSLGSYHWSSSVADKNSAYCIATFYANATVARANWRRSNAYSVRCIQD
jgi:uncharacterized protein (TIGR02145 family)